MIHREVDIINWAASRNLFERGTKAGQFNKTQEEVDELRDAISTWDRDGVRDAIGDIIVTLAIQAKMWNLTLTECIEAAWNEIKDRKGVLKDGIFVKESGAKVDPD